MNQKLKKIIFKKLYRDLSHVEIIPHEKSIWFIDRNEKYWYLEYEKCGELWYRFMYFNNFFSVFSMEVREFESVISEWVEEVLNCKPHNTTGLSGATNYEVEEVLNCKPHNTSYQVHPVFSTVEEALSCKGRRAVFSNSNQDIMAQEVLKYKVNKNPGKLELTLNSKVEEVLDYKVNKPISWGGTHMTKVDEVLDCKVNTITSSNTSLMFEVEEILDYKIKTIENYPFKREDKVNEVLNIK